MTSTDNSVNLAFDWLLHVNLRYSFEYIETLPMYSAKKYQYGTWYYIHIFVILHN
jgi:hypothetical protein